MIPVQLTVSGLKTMNQLQFKSMTQEEDLAF